MTTRAGVEVFEYDPDWPQIFRRLKEEIWPSVRDVATSIEHVGSTSIPGMAAKPVIDVDIVIASRQELSSIVVRLEKLGYKHCGNLGIEDRKRSRHRRIGRHTAFMLA
jgi:GrpB-like predicted nucleotidyltransferase (UPF0157 family)